MKAQQQARFDALYQQHLVELKLQGLAPKTIDAYSRAVRRIAGFFDRCPDKLSQAQLKTYFSSLVDSHSWSTVKLDRNGLQFFYRHVLDKQWEWVKIFKPPQVKTLPDILTQHEARELINVCRKLRYRVFFLTLYSTGLRLDEGLTLQVGDIDGARLRIHVRHGKGNQQRYVPMPRVTLTALRRLWASHRHPRLLFPGNKPNTCMDRGGVQQAMRATVADYGIERRITPHSLRHSFMKYIPVFHPTGQPLAVQI